MPLLRARRARSAPAGTADHVVAVIGRFEKVYIGAAGVGSSITPTPVYRIPPTQIPTMPAKQYRNVCFTDFNVTCAPEYPEYVRYAVYQLEECPDTKRPHFQGYMEFSKPVTIHAIKKWLPTAHVSERKGTQDEARVYCMKEDTRVDGPWEHGVFQKQPGNRSDLIDLQQAAAAGATDRELYERFPEAYARYPQFVQKALRFAAEDAAPKLKGFIPRPWQAKVIELVQSEPDPRQVFWFYDPVGGHGKSLLAKHLVQQYGAFYCRGGKSTDIAHVYSYQRIVIVDYVRESAEYVQYGMLEQFKDGMIWSPKFDSCVKVCAVPHVIVFANFEPDMSKMSADRWNLTQLSQLPKPDDVTGKTFYPKKYM